MSNIPIRFVIAADPPKRLDKALARDVPAIYTLSRTRIAHLIQEGAVEVNGQKVTNATYKLAPGDHITLVPPAPEEIAALPEALALDIIYEDAALVVANKAPGMVVHPAPGARQGTLVNALLHHCGDALSGIGGAKRPGIVHRIDKETSGLLVVAKTDAAHQHLAAQFAAHDVDRAYLALCYGAPSAADPRLAGLRGVDFEPGNVMRVRTMLDRHRHDRQRQAVFFERGRHALTRAKHLESYGQPAQLSLIECRLETGRTHQIRVHMAYCGHGLIGDPTYGAPRKMAKGALDAKIAAAIAAFPRQALHAARLGFIHPISRKPLCFTTPPPEDMQNLIEQLKGT